MTTVILLILVIILILYIIINTKNVQEVIAPKTKIILIIASTISPVSKVVNIPETNPNYTAITNAETIIENKTITGTKTKITNIEKQITTEQ